MHHAWTGFTAVQFSASFFNSSPYDKVLDLSKLQALAEDNLNVNKKIKFVLEMIENIVEKIDFFFFFKMLHLQGR